MKRELNTSVVEKRLKLNKNFGGWKGLGEQSQRGQTERKVEVETQGRREFVMPVPLLF